jgi:DNA-binding IclR family transcriptional regulator
VEVGTRQPALISATGRCVAAFGAHDWSEIEMRLARIRWENPPSLETWRAEVGETRRLGFSVDRGAHIRGVTAVASPVLDPRGIISHAIVALGFSEQIERAGIPELSRRLISIANTIGPATALKTSVQT